MLISGLQKTTLLDYPGHIACTIFLGHCNLRCPFCHNMELVLHPEKYQKYSIDDIITYLEGRKGKLDGVAITGGEPLLNSDIDTLIKPIKDLSFKVKIDTNGFFSEQIRHLIDEKLVDMFAMDIKAGFSNYNKVIGMNNNIINNNEFDLNNIKNKIENSISLIKNSGIEYEFRTTCVKGLHEANDFFEIREMISGANKYFLQNYKKAPGMEDLPYESFTKDELTEFKNIVKETVKDVEIRGID